MNTKCTSSSLRSFSCSVMSVSYENTIVNGFDNTRLKLDDIFNSDNYSFVKDIY